MSPSLSTGREPSIAIFWPPPPEETTVERYREIADLGANLVITGNYLNDPKILHHALSCADEVGLRVVVASDSRIDVLMRHFDLATADAQALLRQVIDDYLPHPSFAGIGLLDEPEPDRFPNLALAVDIIRQRASWLLAYVNLLPSSAIEPYDEYVGGFVDAVDPAILSFDRYPFLCEVDDPHYFHDLATIRGHALRRGIPAWLYLQTLGYHGHREPNAREMLWQVNTALAYGFTGFQYFTYWTPDPSRGEDFEPALVHRGLRTPRYEAVRRINTEWLTPVARQLRGLRSTGVAHADQVPRGASAFRPDPWVRSIEGNAIAGTFAGAGPDRHLFVCNASHRETSTVVVRLDAQACTAQRFDPRTGTFQPVATADLVLSLPPAEASLLRLRPLALPG